MFYINTFTSIENGTAAMVMIPVSALSQKHTCITKNRRKFMFRLLTFKNTECKAAIIYKWFITLF